jgi:transcriptional regulator with XRE-family HTH domain
MDDGFGVRLRELREQAGLTQQQLANAAGLHRFGIAKLEQGVREPSWATVKALCDALGVDCTAFTQEPADREPAGPGRPRKADHAGAEKPPTKSRASKTGHHKRD